MGLLMPRLSMPIQATSIAQTPFQQFGGPSQEVNQQFFSPQVMPAPQLPPHTFPPNLPFNPDEITALLGNGFSGGFGGGFGGSEFGQFGPGMF